MNSSKNSSVKDRMNTSTTNTGMATGNHSKKRKPSKDTTTKLINNDSII